MTEFGADGNSKNEILDNQNECSENDEKATCIEKNDNVLSATIDELHLSEFSGNDQSFDYMETFQDMSFQCDDLNRKFLPGTDYVFDNDSEYSDSSSSASSDTGDYLPEDPFFDAVDDEDLGSSGDTLTVRSINEFLFMLHPLHPFSSLANCRSQFSV